MGESATNGNTHAGRPKYTRVLLKLGGEMFGGGAVGLDPDVVALVARQIAEVVRSGVQVAVVIGGGNFFRGAQLQQRGMERTRSDYMGMLGTVMNSLALQDFLEKEGIADAGADGDHHGSGRRALHPAARPPAPREGTGGHLRSRHGSAVLLHRHHRRAARPGDRRRGGADGQGGRRRVHRRPAGQPGRRTAHRRSPTARSSIANCAWPMPPLSACAWTMACRSWCSTC